MAAASVVFGGGSERCVMNRRRRSLIVAEESKASSGSADGTVRYRLIAGRGLGALCAGAGGCRRQAAGSARGKRRAGGARGVGVDMCFYLVPSKVPMIT